MVVKKGSKILFRSFWNAASPVDHADGRRIRADSKDFQLDFFSVLIVLRGVFKQVENDLLELVGVRIDEQFFVGPVGMKNHILLRFGVDCNHK